MSTGLSRPSHLDPGFAIAWQQLHDTYNAPAAAIFLQDLADSLRQQKAEAALNEVRRLAPDSYIYHQILWQRAFDKGDWSEARQEYAQATSKAGALGIRLGADANLPFTMGKFRDAIAMLELQRARDPLNVHVATDSCRGLRQQRRFSQGISPSMTAGCPWKVAGPS